MIVSVFLAVALVTPEPAAGVSVEYARQFLTAFAAEPSKTRNWFASDAGIAFGDIGEGVSQALSILKESGGWMKTCQVSQLQQMPVPPGAEMSEGPPRLKGGTLSFFQGTYSCARVGDGSASNVKFSLVFKDNRVVMLGLGEGPHHG